jgi:hypothetical protein
MAALFKYVPWQVQQLVNAVSTGTLTLPYLQRPFVWPATKVRDLFDSMYRGYPVGQLMFWQTGAEVGARQIGTDQKTQVATHSIVDGQQRLASLYTVIVGVPIVLEDYREARIRIGFNPFTERFEVTTPAIENSAEWLSDITLLFQDPITVVQDFVEAATEAKGLDKESGKDLTRVLTRLSQLNLYSFTVVELENEADEVQVAEIFVRINSEGITLNQADFILTLMSVFWEDGRKALEAFSRSARVLPAAGKPTSFNWHIKPKPEELLRVVVAVGLNRGRLKNAYSALRGRDIVTGKVDVAKRAEQFSQLVGAQKDVLNLVHWSSFMKCLERAGYRSERLISSKNAILYSYSMWIIGRTKFGVPILELREIIARWFFMASLTGRYSGPFESTVEEDLSRLEELTSRTPAVFTSHLQQQIDTALTPDFWTITVPAELDSSSSRSPALFAYIAALNILDAEALLAKVSVRSWLDPAIVSKKGVERHHLFPRNYLIRHLGLKNPRQINQIANYALVEWADNIAVSDKAPIDYWESELSKKDFGVERLARQRYWHAIPPSWPNITYDDFLSQRRRMIATVIHDAYKQLCDSDYKPEYPAPDLNAIPTQTRESAPHLGVSIRNLMDVGLLEAGSVLVPRISDFDAVGEVTESGTIIVEGIEYKSPSAAGQAASGYETNGWTFWLADTPNGQKSLDQLRKEYASIDADEETPSGETLSRLMFEGNRQSNNLLE